jgi:hypothetical protein
MNRDALVNDALQAARELAQGLDRAHIRAHLRLTTAERIDRVVESSGSIQSIRLAKRTRQSRSTIRAQPA